MLKNPEVELLQLLRSKLASTKVISKWPSECVVAVKAPEFGQVSLGQIRELTNNVGDNFDEHVARGSHGIDYGLESGTEIFLKNGASVVSSEPTEHGDYVVIELPNGDRYSFLHGKR